MKKIILFIVGAVTLFSSCTRETFNTSRPPLGDNVGIRLTPVCTAPGTKADTEAGNAAYNENIINNYCWFVFSDETGETLVTSGYSASDASTDVLLDDFDAFKDGGSGYVYVVANLPVKPETITGDADYYEYIAAKDTDPAAIKRTVIKGGETTETVYGATFAELKTLQFDTKFYAYTSSTTGLPDPDPFVMRTAALAPFTLTEEEPSMVVTASLARASVKIILDMKVAEEVDEYKTLSTGAEDYVKTWYSDVEHIQVYLLWGSTHGTLDGAPISYETSSSDYFYSASPRYAMYDSNNGGYYNSTTRKVEGYVTTAKNEKQTLNAKTTSWEITYKVREDANGDPIWNWKSDVDEADKTEANIGNTAYGDWDYELDENNQKIEVKNADGSTQYHLVEETVTKDYWILSSTPMYSTPITWSVNDSHAPFIKVILPWHGYDKEKEEWDMKDGEKLSTEYYYKILVPKTTTLVANNLYRISLDLSVLGSTSDDMPVEVTGNYYVVDWNTPEKMGGEQSAGRYLNVASSFEMYSTNSLPITVSSSHDIEVVTTGTYRPTGTYNNYSGTTVTTGNLTYSATSDTDNYFTVTASGNNKVTLSHKLETDMSKMNSRDVAKITYTFRIRHKDNTAYYKDITVVQYPSLYIESKASNGYVFVNQYGGQSDHVSAWDNSGTTRSFDQGWGGTTYSQAFLGNVRSTAAFSGGSNSNSNNYNINVSALNNLPDALKDCYIADPREDTGSTLANITQLSNYRKSRADAVWAIAPRFKIASSYGMCISFSSGNTKSGAPLFENAIKRCATYQENGYPAGRWRVPTRAEIMFVYYLSDNGCIPSLFNSAYFAADGYYFNTEDFDSSDPSNFPWKDGSGVRAPVRCVYDVWYWGDEQDTAHLTTWGGFQTD